MRKALPDEESEKQFAEDAWLTYFNRYLFECGTISEKEYKKMRPVRTMTFERHDRTAVGHKIAVTYAFSLAV